MSREIVINATKHESRIAVLDEGQVVELWVERSRQRTIVGNIYKGRVTRVLPGMQSAFVDLGLERDAFLYVPDFLEEQEDQEEFEQVASLAHSEAQTEPSRPKPQQLQAAEGAATEVADSHPDSADQTQADGTQLERGPRRWRGRRGRRRGRGGFQEQGAPQTAGQEGSSEEEGVSESSEQEAI